MEPRFLLATYLPTLLNPQVPADAPLLPSAFDKFSPPVRVTSIASAAPIIADAGKTASPSDSVTLSADQLSRLSGGSFGADTTFWLYGQTSAKNGTLKSVSAAVLDAPTATITLDSSLPDDSMYLLWARNASGYSSPVAINKTEAWWISQDNATRGDTVSIYGRNLAHDSTNTQSWVYIRPVGKGATGQWVSVSSVNPYKVDFSVPANLPNGTYEVWAHNGHGGNFGWASPLTLTIQNATTWSGPTLNVKSFGARGDGVTNDYQAISKAIQAASAAPANSTLYFPAGTYVTAGALLGLPSNVRVVGDGAAKSIIKAAPGYKLGALISRLGDNTEFRDLGIDATNCGWSTGFVLITGGAKNVNLTNVNFNSPIPQAVDFTGTVGAHVTNCNFIARGTTFNQTRQVIIDHSNFYGTYDSNVLVHFVDATQASITNCTAQDFDNSDPTNGAGWATGRFLEISGLHRSASELYVANNQTRDLGVRPYAPDQNAGEQINIELNQTVWMGSPSAASTTTITIPGLTDLQGADRVYVTAGKGLGQYRSIVAFNPQNGTITLDQPWSVAPNPSSTVGVGSLSDHIAIYNNRLDGKAQQVTQAAHTALAAIELYGGTMDLVADSNNITDVRWGMYVAIPSFGVKQAPIYSNLFVNNQVTNSRVGAYLSAAAQNTATGMYGNIFRGNTFDTAFDRAFDIGVDGASANSAMTNVLEHNTIRNATYAVTFKNNPFKDMLISDTYANRGTSLFGGSIGLFDNSHARPTLVKNTWLNFERSQIVY